MKSTGVVLIGLMCFLTACSPPLATNISASIDKGLVSSDKIRLKNETGTDYRFIDGKVELKYSDRTQKLKVSWSNWKNGETKVVEVPAAVTGLQTYSLNADYVGAEGGSNPKHRGTIEASWYNR
jgi:hypothetical protein